MAGSAQVYKQGIVFLIAAFLQNLRNNMRCCFNSQPPEGGW